MSKYDWNSIIPKSVWKTQETLNGLASSALAISEVWKSAIPHYDFIGIRVALNTYWEDYESISQQAAQISSIAASVLPLIDTSVYASLVDSQAIKAAVTSVDWSWITQSQEQESAHGVESVDQELITQEIHAEMAADITQVLSKPEEMSAVSHSMYLQWKEKIPALPHSF